MWPLMASSDVHLADLQSIPCFRSLNAVSESFLARYRSNVPEAVNGRSDSSTKSPSRLVIMLFIAIFTASPSLLPPRGKILHLHITKQFELRCFLRAPSGIDVLPDRLHLVPIAFGLATITAKYVGTQLQVPEDVPGPSEIVLGPHERYIVIYPHPPVAMRPDECIVRCVLSHMCVTNPRPLESSILVLSIEYALLLNTIVAPFGSIGRTYFSVSSKYVTSRMFPHSRSIP